MAQEQKEQIYADDASTFVIQAPPNAPALYAVTKREDVISLGDESALNWYFARGIGIYERSPFGGIIDRLKYGALASNKCGRCKGSGILDDGGFRVDDKCRRCNGEGSEPGGTGMCALCRGTRRESGYSVNVNHGGWCGSCKGTGATEVDRRGTAPTPCGSCGGKRKTRACKNCGECALCKGAQACRNCRNCLGTGVEPVSVNSTGVEGASGRDSADDSALTRFAVTSRRLERVKAKSPRLFSALVAYYGDLGARWVLTDHGQIFALYHLTAAGKTLARAAVADNDKTPAERIGVQANEDAKHPKRERTMLLDAAGAEARELYASAAVAWNTAREGAPSKGTKALVKRVAQLGYLELANHIASQTVVSK